MESLLSVNVNSHTEKKNGLTYLSWAWAWAEVLKLDPGARWHAVEYSNAQGCALPCMYLNNGTAMVKVEVMIKGETKQCLLPVMDHKNKAIPNPDAMDINKAIMRCLAKAISMHGLGLYIYAGEDLPEIDYLKAIESAPDLDALKAHFAAAYRLAEDRERPALEAAKDKRKAQLTTKEVAA